MFGFLKKLFGSDAETNKAAGVQIEQAPVVDAKVEAANQAPYKVETPAAPAPAPVAAPVAKAPAKKKPQAVKPKAEKVAQKPAAITAPKKSGRKPKSKA
jgi:hypothetical protein